MSERSQKKEDRSQKPLIRLVNIHKSYRMGNDVVPVLRGVNLDVFAGEFVAIMGASGSGKSTLLHIAGALDRPDQSAALDAGENPPPPRRGDNEAGQQNTRANRPDAAGRRKPLNPRAEVFFRAPDAAAELPISQMGLSARHELRNRHFGFVFQFYHLLPELNVLENVLLPSMIPLFGTSHKAEAIRLIEAFGLKSRIRHRPGQLSGGERQRVAIARALINRPALLLADEPTGNLDAKTGRAILDVLVKLHREQNQTLLLVTHDPNVAALADRTVNLVEGRIK